MSFQFYFLFSITIDNSNIFWYVLAAILIILFLIGYFHASISEYKRADEKVKDIQQTSENQKLIYEKEIAQLNLKVNEMATIEFNKFKDTEIQRLRATLEENATQGAVLKLEKWLVENEMRIRADAANRSWGVTMGKAIEHLLPFYTSFPFNASDARFIGSPVDLIVFEGLTDEKESIDIVFLEIKTGKSRLSIKQQRIKSAIINRRVTWREVTAPV